MTHDTTDSDDESETDAMSRRAVIVASATAAVGAAGYATGHAAAQTSPSGTFPVDSDEPLLRVRTERINLVERQSAPAENGVLYWDGSA